MTASQGAYGPSLNWGSLSCTTLNPNTRQVLGSTPSSGRGLLLTWRYWRRRAGLGWTAQYQVPRAVSLECKAGGARV